MHALLVLSSTCGVIEVAPGMAGAEVAGSGEVLQDE